MAKVNRSNRRIAPHQDNIIFKEPTNKIYLSSILDAIVIFCVTLYAWQQSHYQLGLYSIEKSVLKVLIAILISTCIFGAILGILQKIPKQFFILAFTYAMLCLIFGAISTIANDINILFYIKAIILTLVMFWIVRDYRRIKFFLWLNFLLGFTLILLNSVTILHWLDLFELSHESVTRVGGQKNLTHLNPYYFGIYGLTENYIYPGSYFGTPRLQGWASEPLHWSYFVLLTFSCAAMLTSIYRNTVVRIHLFLSMFLILLYVFFMQSTTLYISSLAILMIVMAVGIFNSLRFSNEKITLLYFFALIIVPGLLIPFLLVSTVGISELFYGETFFGKGGNWSSKIKFLSLGNDIYFRFLPSPSSLGFATHNFILEKYLVGGYLMLAPLLWFLYKYIKYIGNKSFMIIIAVSTAIIANTLTVPTHFFYPLGAMWFFIIAGLVAAQRNITLPTRIKNR